MEPRERHVREFLCAANLLMARLNTGRPMDPTDLALLEGYALSIQSAITLFKSREAVDSAQGWLDLTG